MLMICARSISELRFLFPFYFYFYLLHFLHGGERLKTNTGFALV